MNADGVHDQSADGVHDQSAEGVHHQSAAGVPADFAGRSSPVTWRAVSAWTVVALAVGLAASISLAEAALAVLLLCVVAQARGGAGPQLSAPLALPVMAFSAWTVIAALGSARPGESLASARTLMWLATMYVVLHALPDSAAARRFATLLFVLVAAVGLLAIVQVAACPEAPPDVIVLDRFFRKCSRAKGFFSIYMTLAGVLTLALVSALAWLPRAGRAALWMAPAWLVGLVALELTYVRGAWLGLAVGVLTIAGALKRRAVILLGVAVVTMAAAVLLPGVLHRVRTIGNLQDDTARDRLAMLHGGLRMVLDHPITGVGPGQVKRLYPVYAPPEALRHSTSHLHNTPLQILVERGAIGLAFWLWLYAAFFARAAAIYRRLPEEKGGHRALVLGVIAAIAAFLVAGLFEYNFGDTEVLLVASTLMALPFVIERDLEESANRSPATKGVHAP